MVILAAVDGDDIPSQVVETGYDLAQHYDGELVVLHVMPQQLFDEYQGTDPWKERLIDDNWRYRNLPQHETEHSDRRPFTIEDAKQTAKRQARRVTNETLEEWENISFVGAVGHPSEEIIREANDQASAFLVIGGRKRSALNEALFGSTSRRILRNINLPVVSIHRNQ